MGKTSIIDNIAFPYLDMEGEAWFTSNVYFPGTSDSIPFILGLCLSV